jgi:hypothetical protein
MSTTSKIACVRTGRSARAYYDTSRMKRAIQFQLVPVNLIAVDFNPTIERSTRLSLRVVLGWGL